MQTLSLKYLLYLLVFFFVLILILFIVKSNMLSIHKITILRLKIQACAPRAFNETNSI